MHVNSLMLCLVGKCSSCNMQICGWKEINRRERAGPEDWPASHVFIYSGGTRLRDVQKQKQGRSALSLGNQDESAPSSAAWNGKKGERSSGGETAPLKKNPRQSRQAAAQVACLMLRPLNRCDIKCIQEEISISHVIRSGANRIPALYSWHIWLCLRLPRVYLFSLI